LITSPFVIPVFEVHTLVLSAFAHDPMGGLHHTLVIDTTYSEDLQLLYEVVVA
jgi:hypothetical protein